MTSHTNTDLFISFIVLLIVAGLTSYYANRKGRNPMFWFFLGVLLGIFAPLILWFLSKVEKSSDKIEDPTMGVANSDPLLAPLTDDMPALTQQQIGIEEKLWYYLDESHEQMGPVSIIALRELWNRGQLELTSYVWTAGMEQWQKVETLSELRGALNQVV